MGSAGENLVELYNFPGSSHVYCILQPFKVTPKIMVFIQVNSRLIACGSK